MSMRGTAVVVAPAPASHENTNFAHCGDAITYCNNTLLPFGVANNVRTDAKLALALHFSNAVVFAVPSGFVCSLSAGFSKPTISTKPHFPNVSFDCSIIRASHLTTLPAGSNSYIVIAFAMGGAMVASTPTIE
jgi:hypothetical protein